jgi:hypothetical protein
MRSAATVPMPPAPRRRDSKFWHHSRPFPDLGKGIYTGSMRRANEDDGNVLANACKMAGNLLWRWDRGHVRNGIWKYSMSGTQKDHCTCPSSTSSISYLATWQAGTLSHGKATLPLLTWCLTHSHTDRYTSRHPARQTDTQPGKPTPNQANRHPTRQTDTQPGKPTPPTHAPLSLSPASSLVLSSKPQDDYRACTTSSVHGHRS